MIGEINKKHHLKNTSDNTSKMYYLRYSGYHHLNESNIGSFKQVITDYSVVTNIFTDSLEAISL